MDLRRDGGGSLEEAINLTGLFIPKGPVVQSKDPSGKITVSSDRNPEISYSGPMIVLMNRLSASASEILRQHCRTMVALSSSGTSKASVKARCKPSLNSTKPWPRFLFQYGTPPSWRTQADNSKVLPHSRRLNAIAGSEVRHRPPPPAQTILRSVKTRSRIAFPTTRWLR